MKVYTSYFGNAKTLTKNGIVLVSIARKNPVWFNGSSLIHLAPPAKLFYNKTLSDAQWNEQYEKQVCRKVNLRDLSLVLKNISDMNGGRDIALLCYEKNPDECHRQVLARYLNANGFDIREYEVDTRQVEKIEQGSLF